MGALLCAIGLHQWQVDGEASTEGLIYRRCRRCGRERLAEIGPQGTALGPQVMAESERDGQGRGPL